MWDPIQKRKEKRKKEREDEICFYNFKHSNPRDSHTMCCRRYAY